MYVINIYYLSYLTFYSGRSGDGGCSKTDHALVNEHSTLWRHLALLHEVHNKFFTLAKLNHSISRVYINTGASLQVSYQCFQMMQKQDCKISYILLLVDIYAQHIYLCFI